ELAIGLLEFALRRAPSDAEHLVVVPLAHALPLSMRCGAKPARPKGTKCAGLSAPGASLSSRARGRRPTPAGEVEAHPRGLLGRGRRGPISRTISEGPGYSPPSAWPPSLA